MMRFEAEALSRWSADLLQAVGMRRAEAEVVADSLVAADLRGVHTHGVVRLPVYVERMRRGLVAVRPEIRVDRLAAAAATVDGGNGPGQLAGHRAMAEAVAMARDAGAAVVTVSRSSHFGAAAWYTLPAAAQGMVGVALSHAEADVVPYGGRSPALGTNPISLAVPGPPDQPPVVLDMASSAVAMGRVLLARQEGSPIPAGWAVDRDGRPTTDPSEAVAVVPMAGPKGYGLAFFVDVLSALLTGAAFGADIRRMYDDFAAPQGLGHLFMAIDIERFVPLTVFRDRMAAFCAQLRGVRPAEGFERVLLPGEPELSTEREHLQAGIPLSEATVEQLQALAARQHVPFIPPG